MEPRNRREGNNRRRLSFAGLALAVLLTVWSGVGFAGKGEWSVSFNDDVLGNCVDYTIINQEQTFLMGLTVYRDRVFIRTWPLPWTDTITIEVEGGSLEGGKFGKLYSAKDKDCERTMGNIVFIIKGDSARAIIQALEKGAKAVIRETLRPWEFEPRGTFPLQEFKDAYERAMKGRGDSGLSGPPSA
jgi:hypothetical protein